MHISTNDKRKNHNDHHYPTDEETDSDPSAKKRKLRLLQGVIQYSLLPTSNYRLCIFAAPLAVCRLGGLAYPRVKTERGKHCGRSVLGTHLFRELMAYSWSTCSQHHGSDMGSELVERTKAFCRGHSEWEGSEAADVPLGVRKGPTQLCIQREGTERGERQLERQVRVYWIGAGGPREGGLLRGFKPRRNATLFLSEEEHSWQSMKDGMDRQPLF